MHGAYIDIKKAIKCAFELATLDMIVEVEVYLRRVILDPIQNCEMMPCLMAKITGRKQNDVLCHSTLHPSIHLGHICEQIPDRLSEEHSYIL